MTLSRDPVADDPVADLTLSRSRWRPGGRVREKEGCSATSHCSFRCRSTLRAVFSRIARLRRRTPSQSQRCTNDRGQTYTIRRRRPESKQGVTAASEAVLQCRLPALTDCPATENRQSLDRFIAYQGFSRTFCSLAFISSAISQIRSMIGSSSGSSIGNPKACLATLDLNAASL